MGPEVILVVSVVAFLTAVIALIHVLGTLHEMRRGRLRIRDPWTGIAIGEVPAESLSLLEALRVSGFFKALLVYLFLGTVIGCGTYLYLVTGQEWLMLVPIAPVFTALLVLTVLRAAKIRRRRAARGRGSAPP